MICSNSQLSSSDQHLLCVFSLPLQVQSLLLFRTRLHQTDAGQKQMCPSLEIMLHGDFAAIVSTQVMLIAELPRGRAFESDWPLLGVFWCCLGNAKNQY